MEMEEISLSHRVLTLEILKLCFFRHKRVLDSDSFILQSSPPSLAASGGTECLIIAIFVILYTIIEEKTTAILINHQLSFLSIAF